MANQNGNFEMERSKVIDALTEDRKLTRKERFERLASQVAKAKIDLIYADTVETVDMALNELAKLMNNLSEDVQVTGEVKGIVRDIYGSIYRVRVYDCTRSDLDEMLDILLERTSEVIAEEAKKEKARKLNELFTELANHSEEIAKIIFG